jgi:hypothetical protein
MKYIVTIQEKYQEEVEAKTVADAKVEAQKILLKNRKSGLASPIDTKIYSKRVREKVVHISSNQKKRAARALKENIK